MPHPIGATGSIKSLLTSIFSIKKTPDHAAAASSGLEYVTVTENGRQKDQFVVYFSLYPLSNYKVQAYVGFLLDMTYCQQFFSFNQLQEEGAFRLLDAQGDVLYCSENTPQSIQAGDRLFKDDDMMLFSYQPGKQPIYLSALCISSRDLFQRMEWAAHKPCSVLCRVVHRCRPSFLAGTK